MAHYYANGNASTSASRASSWHSQERLGSSLWMCDRPASADRSGTGAFARAEGRAGASVQAALDNGMDPDEVGRIVLDGVQTQGLPPHAIAALGLQLVPEERRIFGSLNVEENLLLAALTATSRWPLDRVWEIFPRLKERRRSRGTDLSGGEQQMLAIARALVRDPKLLLLDEPFEGLAPIIVRDLLATCRALAEAGQTILVVEQNISAAMSLADRVYIINNGHIVEALTKQAVKDNPEILHRHLGV